VNQRRWLRIWWWLDIRRQLVGEDGGLREDGSGEGVVEQMGVHGEGQRAPAASTEQKAEMCLFIVGAGGLCNLSGLFSIFLAQVFLTFGSSFPSIRSKFFSEYYCLKNKRGSSP
jgi:hypothetical protein